jgi:hypothetical protein
MRPRALAGLALSGLVMGGGAGCASPGRSDDIVPSALVRPGWCHRLSDPAELYAPSDIAPAVPCSSPHRSETFATVRLPSGLTRPPGSPGHTGDLTSQVCAGPTSRTLRTYLGADDLDRHWGIDVWLKVPTREEWAKGLRVGRCDLVLGRDGPGPVPELTHRLRGALRRADSAAIRHCRRGLVHVTCDRPHTAEEVGGWTGIVAAAYPGAFSAARQLRDQCWRNAEQYTEGAVDSLPMRVTTGPLSAGDWRAGKRTTDCWIATEDGRSTRGTLRADLAAVRTGGAPR